jgi:uncharacterized membrane protein YdjX (TVP38/TMEM64 family)
MSRQDEASLPLVWRSVAIGLVALGAVALAGHSIDAHTWLTADGLRNVVGAEWYAPLAYVAVVCGAMFLPLPKFVLLALAGVLFGPWWGFVYAWIAQVLGMTALFVVARTSLRPIARRLVREHIATIRQIEGHLDARGILIVAVIRLFYFMGTPISIMLSATRLRVIHFMLGTALGVIPAIALSVFSADAATSGATPITAAIIGVSIVLVLGLGTLIRRRLRF